MSPPPAPERVPPIDLSEGPNSGIVTLGHDRAAFLIEACMTYNLDVGNLVADEEVMADDPDAENKQYIYTLEHWQLEYQMRSKSEACEWELTGFLHSTGIDFRDYWDRLTASYAGAFDHIEALEKLFADFSRMARDQAKAIDKLGSD